MNDLDKNGVYKITNTINGKIYIGSTFCEGGFKWKYKEDYHG